MTRTALAHVDKPSRDQQLNRGQRRERPTARARPRHVEVAGDDVAGDLQIREPLGC